MGESHSILREPCVHAEEYFSSQMGHCIQPTDSGIILHTAEGTDIDKCWRLNVSYMVPESLEILMFVCLQKDQVVDKHIKCN